MAKATNGWTAYGAGRLGPLELKADGSYSIAGLNFGQDTSLDNVSIGDARFDKRPGAGQELVIAAPDKTHRLKYEGGAWYYRAS